MKGRVQGSLNRFMFVHKQVSFCSPRTYVELWYKIHVGSRHEKIDALLIFDPSTMKFRRAAQLSAALWHHQK
jgi:hypothetical protein